MASVLGQHPFEDAVRVFCHADETTFEADVDESDIVEGDGWKTVSLTVLCPRCKQPYGILSVDNFSSRFRVMPGVRIPGRRVAKGKLVFANEA